MTTYKDRGKWAEAQAQKWLEKKADNELGFAWHRYPDARSARGALANQPSDLLVAHKSTTGVRRAWHLEVKETKEARRLPKAKIGQYAKLKLFHYAGITPVVVVFRSILTDWVVIDAENLMGHEVVPASFSMIGLKSHLTVGSALTSIFN